MAKLDRLTRLVRDLGTLLETYFKSRFNLLSVADQVDTRSAARRFVLNLLTSVAEWERETIGERTAAALAHKQAQGVRLGAPLLEHSETLTRMRELRNSGMTYREVCRALTREGYRTLKGGPWRPGTVKRILDRMETGA